MSVIAIIVSKMDHPLGEVLAPIQACPEISGIRIVRGVDGIFARWEALLSLPSANQIVYTQDDDAVVDVAAVLREFDPHKLTCNMPPAHRRDYRDDIALVGWGAVFLAALPIHALARYDTATYESDGIFVRECDRVVAGLSPLKLIDVPIRHLPQAYGENRMGGEKRHGDDLREIRRRIYAIRGK